MCRYPGKMCFHYKEMFASLSIHQLRVRRKKEKIGKVKTKKQNKTKINPPFKTLIKITYKVRIIYNSNS